MKVYDAANIRNVALVGHSGSGKTQLVSAALFILALRWMSQPETAKRAVMAAVGGMALAVGGTLLHPEIVTYKWIGIAAALGFIVGFPLSRVPLTAVPTGARGGTTANGRLIASSRVPAIGVPTPRRDSEPKVRGTTRYAS